MFISGYVDTGQDSPHSHGDQWGMQQIFLALNLQDATLIRLSLVPSKNNLAR